MAATQGRVGNCEATLPLLGRSQRRRCLAQEEILPVAVREEECFRECFRLPVLGVNQTKVSCSEKTKAAAVLATGNNQSKRTHCFSNGHGRNPIPGDKRKGRGEVGSWVPGAVSLRLSFALAAFARMRVLSLALTRMRVYIACYLRIRRVEVKR